MKDVPVYHRADLAIGSLRARPGAHREDETTTIVPMASPHGISPIGAILSGEGADT